MLQFLTKASSQRPAVLNQLFSKKQEMKRCSLDQTMVKKATFQLRDVRQKKLRKDIHKKQKNRHDSRASNFLHALIYPYNNNLDGLQNLTRIKILKHREWDLTETLCELGISNTLLIILFIVLIIVRYTTILFNIYLIVRIQSVFWEIYLFLFITGTFYWLSLLKISFRDPETNTEILLKVYFDSLSDNQIGITFTKIQTRKLIRTIIKACTPPQFSFLYIGTLFGIRKKKTYLIVNFIYCSIQSVIYTPGYLISLNLRQIGKGFQNAILAVNILLIAAWCCFAILCVLLAIKSRSNSYSPID